MAGLLGGSVARAGGRPGEAYSRLVVGCQPEASNLSFSLHSDGIGLAWAAMPGGQDGWYRALVAAVIRNINSLEELQQNARSRWRREWYAAVDLLVIGAVVATVVMVAEG